MSEIQFKIEIIDARTGKEALEYGFVGDHTLARKEADRINKISAKEGRDHIVAILKPITDEKPKFTELPFEQQIVEHIQQMGEDWVQKTCDWYFAHPHLQESYIMDIQAQQEMWLFEKLKRSDNATDDQE